MNKIHQLIHVIMMFVSLNYRKKFEVTKLLAELQGKVGACGYFRMHNGTSEVRRLISNDTGDFRDLIRQITILDKERRSEAIGVLTNSDNVILLGLAVELSPEVATTCADRLMGFAEQNMKFCGHTDRAMWAKSELLLAREWYEKAQELSHAREYEIEQNLTKLIWIG